MDEPGARMGKGALVMLDKMFTRYGINKQFGKKIKEFVNEGLFLKMIQNWNPILQCLLPPVPAPRYLKHQSSRYQKVALSKSIIFAR